MARKAKKKYTSIGGQALMEGIMMRGPEKTAMAVRRADDSIHLEIWKNKKPSIWSKIPIIRGVYSFIYSMVSGSKTLMRSAELAIEDEEKAEAAKAAAEKAAEAAIAEEAAALAEKTAAEETTEEAVEETAETVEEAEVIEEAAEVPTGVDGSVMNVYEVESPEEIAKKEKAEEKSKKTEKKSGGKKDKKKDDDLDGLTFFSTLLGVGLAMVLFVFLPTWCYRWLLLIPEVKSFVGDNGDMWKSIIEGVIKIIVFIGYVLLCTTMKEIRRVFEYHGAEHKTIFCYEAGEELTVENVKKYKRFHPRCGTSFIVLMVLVSIIAGICISAFLPKLVGWYDDTSWMRPVAKLLVLPIVMGVGYELLKLCGKHDNIITKIICAPGLWVQRITTREPDDGMIECAIAALKPVIPDNGEDMK